MNLNSETQVSNKGREMMGNRRVALIARRLGVGLGLCAALASQAAPVTYNFAGDVTASALQSQFAIGSGFSGSFTFESTASDTNASTTAGQYDTGFSISATLGGITYSSHVAAGGVLVWNGDGGIDRFDAIVQGVYQGPTLVDASTAIPGFDPFILRAVFDDSTASTFSSDSLPVSPLSLGAFSGKALMLSFYSGFQQVNVDGRITSLSLVDAGTPNGQTVPEPQSLALTILGLALAGASKARRKS